MIWFSIHQQTHLINSSAADQHRPLLIPHHTRILTVVVGSSNTVGSYRGCETQPEKPTSLSTSTPHEISSPSQTAKPLRSRHHQDWPATVKGDHGQDRSKPISRK